jgi:hypothetical protein
LLDEPDSNHNKQNVNKNKKSDINGSRREKMWLSAMKG